MKTSSEKEKKLGTVLGKLVNLNLNANPNLPLDEVTTHLK